MDVMEKGKQIYQGTQTPSSPGFKYEYTRGDCSAYFVYPARLNYY